MVVSKERAKGYKNQSLRITCTIKLHKNQIMILGMVILTAIITIFICPPSPIRHTVWESRIISRITTTTIIIRLGILERNQTIWEITIIPREVFYGVCYIFRWLMVTDWRRIYWIPLIWFIKILLLLLLEIGEVMGDRWAHSAWVDSKLLPPPPPQTTHLVVIYHLACNFSSIVRFELRNINNFGRFKMLKIIR